MQDIHGFGGDGRRFFGGGDRRMRPHNNPNHQALKCPRCESLNTKFCYYNNYNLSQPRHFCKSCRRYWTKGGVLRNIPVGGGCRKTKCSKQKIYSGDPSRQRNSNTKSSSSESSSLTAAATATSATPNNVVTSSSMVYGFPDSTLFNSNVNKFDHKPVVNQSETPDGQTLTGEIGAFTSLQGYSGISVTSSLGMADIQMTSYGQVNQGNQASVEDNSGLEMRNMTSEISNDDLAADLDWGRDGGGYQGLFDLTAAVGPGYWNQNQWSYNEQSLNYQLP